MAIFRIGAGIKLRFYQKAVFKAFDNGKRWIVLNWSRRLGKTVVAWLLIIREAIRKPGIYWYCFNNYSTAYNDIWLAMTKTGVKFLDMIPADMIARTNVAKLEIELKNGSVIKLIGINNVDKLVGAGLMGVVFDEYAVLNPSSIELITAMLGETGGWRVMISTPRGKNHFFVQREFALQHPEFAYEDDKNTTMPEVAKFYAPHFLETERLAIINKYGNDALYQQEYCGSFVSPNSGSVFGALTKIMKDSGRVTVLTPDKNMPFYTAWDLGNSDFTSIVLFQVDADGFPYILDHIENRNEDVGWYIGEMISRGWRPSAYFLPHDGAYHKGARNETYKQVMERDYNIKNIIVLNKPNRVEDKLNHLRRKFVGLHVDERLTRILECLDKMEYEWIDKLHIWSDKPTHNGGYSDTVDSLCYACQAIEKYDITSKNVFSLVHLKGEEKESTPEEKKSRLDKMIESELFADSNLNNSNNCSPFVL